MMVLLWLIGAVLLVSFGFIVLRGAPYVPTHSQQLDIAFDELYQLSKKDIIVDLGSGDGIVLRAAVSRGARAIGYELNPILALISRLRLKNNKKITIFVKDFLTLNELPTGVTVVYAFTTGHNIEAIGSKLEQWAKHSKIYFISYGFLLKNKLPTDSKGPMHLYTFKPSEA